MVRVLYSPVRCRAEYVVREEAAEEDAGGGAVANCVFGSGFGVDLVFVGPVGDCASADGVCGFGSPVGGLEVLDYGSLFCVQEEVQDH